MESELNVKCWLQLLMNSSSKMVQVSVYHLSRAGDGIPTMSMRRRSTNKLAGNGCFVSPSRRCLTMISLQHHGIEEAHKQLHLRMKRSGLNSIKVIVTRRAGKLRFNFTGLDEEVKKAEQILADWT